MIGGDSLARVSEGTFVQSTFSVDVGQPESGESLLVLGVPGFRTNGDWINAARLAGETWQRTIEFKPAHGDPLGETALIARWQIAKHAKKLRLQIEDQMERNPGRPVSVVCHSLGCDVFRRAIKGSDFQFHVIVFLGSVCQRRHARELSKSCQLMVNDRADRDWWPVIANWLCPPAFSSTGTFGFNNASVTDRIFENDHGSCTNDSHIKDFVFPVLAGLAVEEPRGVEMRVPFNVARYLGYFFSFLKIAIIVSMLYLVYIAI